MKFPHDPPLGYECVHTPCEPLASERESLYVVLFAQKAPASSWLWSILQCNMKIITFYGVLWGSVVRCVSPPMLSFCLTCVAAHDITHYAGVRTTHTPGKQCTACSTDFGFWVEPRVLYVTCVAIKRCFSLASLGSVRRAILCCSPVYDIKMYFIVNSMP